MNTTVISKLFLVLSILLWGSNVAWGEGEIAFTNGNTIGDESNSGGWFYGISEVINIPANKTLTLKFKTYSATDEQLEGKGDGGSNLTWGAHMSHIIRIGNDGEDLYWRADGYGWKGSENTNGSGWFTFLGSNTRWGTNGAEFREDITGSDVVVTIQRVDTELRITQDFSATSGKYTRYFVVNYGKANDNIWAQLVVERAHVVVSENYSVTNTEVPTITGTQIGLANNTTPFWSAWSDYFTIQPEGSLTLRYKVYTNKINNYNGGLPYVTTDADRAATGYTEYFGLRPDNYVNIAACNATSTNFDEISWNWGTFREKVNGATVTLTITRSGANVTAREEFAPVDGSTTLWEEYTQACGDGNQNIRVFLTAEGAHLDLLPVTASIGTYGWSTFSSDYALDFSKATAGLTAYKVTGHEGNVVTMESVSGTVPAGTGLLLKGDAGSYNIPIVGSSDTDVSANLLKPGTGDDISAATGYTRYVLGVNNNNTPEDTSDDYAEFQKIVSTAATVAKGKAYLEFTGAVPAPSLKFDFDISTPTAINVVETAAKVQQNNEVYNLAGQRVAQPKKGLYIVNGKKVVK